MHHTAHTLHHKALPTIFAVVPPTFPGFHFMCTRQGRRLSLGLLLCAWVLGWAWLVQGQALLWQRLPDTSVNRFVADQITQPLPAKPATDVLMRACGPAPATAWPWPFNRSVQRQALAECLGRGEGSLAGSQAPQASAYFEGLVRGQVAAAELWLQAHDAQAPQQQQALARELAQLQAQPAGGLTPVVRGMAALWPHAVSTREPVGPVDRSDRVAQGLRAQVASTQARLVALSAPEVPAPDRLRALALMATGLKVQADYGYAPARLSLTTDPATLADMLEWQRRAQGYKAHGFTLTRLQGLLAALAASSAVLMAVALWVGCGRITVPLVWGSVSLALGAGLLMLTDLSLTGPVALRYLAERQFQTFGAGAWWCSLSWDLPLAQQGLRLALWWPLLVVAALMLLMARLRDGASPILAPVRGLVRQAGSQRLPSLVVSVALVVLAVGIVKGINFSATASEALIWLGCLGAATYLARQAPRANVGGGWQWDGLLVAMLAMGLSVVGAMARSDFGHALVAMLLTACFVWLFAGRCARVAVLAGVLVLTASLVACWAEGRLVGPLQWVASALPAHAAERLHAQFDPLHAATSDLARVRWLMDSANWGGWGLGYVPWRGLSTAARLHDGLPLQGPSDYVTALTVALWGRAGGLGLMAAMLALFIGAAALALRQALRQGMPVAVRWLAALGGFGCVIMAGKVVLSVGGVSGLLPLTGLPVALVGYGPMSLFAALLYLVLAMGVQHLVPTSQHAGVVLRKRAERAGEARHRSQAMVAVFGLGSVCLVGLAAWVLSNPLGSSGQAHESLARLTVAQVVIGALSTESPVPEQASASMCPELQQAVQVWNQQLSGHPGTVRLADTSADGLTARRWREVPTSELHLDAIRLQSQFHEKLPGLNCRHQARVLGQVLVNDVPRLLGAVGGSKSAVGATSQSRLESRRLSAFDLPRKLAASTADYRTPNVWWGVPGCFYSLGDIAAPRGACTQGTDVAGMSANDITSGQALDPWLQRELWPAMAQAIRRPDAVATRNQRQVAAGPQLGVSLNPAWQTMAQRIADCYTGRQQGEACRDTWPRDAKAQAKYFGTAQALRAGALGLVLTEVDSGRIVALAGALSDCSLTQFTRRASVDATKATPALRDGEPCSQLPDARSAWLVQQHPAFWMVPPGSALKPLSAMAGMDAGLLPEDADDRWKQILAESHEQQPVQNMALQSGARYMEVLRAVGYGQPEPDVLWGQGTSSGKAEGVAWHKALYAGAQNLRPANISMPEFAQILAQKKAGDKRVDKTFGHALMTEYLAAKSVTDAAVGGGEIRINALGLVDIWRSIDLRARGVAQKSGLHLLEHNRVVQDSQDIRALQVASAKRALYMTSGVAASSLKGTAQGACRAVFGGCPPEGPSDMSGKTGSSDFLLHEGGRYIEPGQHMPAKLFGGVFTGPDGKRYAVAAMALRVREGDTATLELSSSAPAEAAFTLMRQMGWRSNF
jgi:cell division protein FtsW (lipid II flippase)